jgi:hypothetical protein
LQRAKAAAQTALKLDGTLARAVLALGFIKGYCEYDWEGAEKTAATPASRNCGGE